jgi:hypothetical protein
LPLAEHRGADVDLQRQAERREQEPDPAGAVHGGDDQAGLPIATGAAGASDGCRVGLVQPLVDEGVGPGSARARRDALSGGVPGRVGGRGGRDIAGVEVHGHLQDGEQQQHEQHRDHHEVDRGGTSLGGRRRASPGRHE